MAAVDFWHVASRVLETDGPHVLLWGPPGTGKSFIGQRPADRETRVYNVTITPDTSAAELRGHWIPGQGGTWRWHDGPAVRAMREGARLVLNELAMAGGDVLALLLAVLDNRDSCVLSLPSGEDVRPVAGFRVVATMNGRPEELLPALRERFGAEIEISSPNPAAFESLPDDIRAAARGSAVAPEADRIGLRAWLAFASLRGSCGEEIAAQAVFGPRWLAVLDSLRVAAAT